MTGNEFSTESSIPRGLCQCGCGERTRIAPYTYKRDGWIKGEPVRFVAGHNLRSTGTPWYERYEERDMGFTSPCWIWGGEQHQNGYGRMRAPDNWKNRAWAHHLYYEQKYGAVPPGAELDHLCHVPMCVNPDHLEPVTHAENMRRRGDAKLNEESVEEIRRLYATGQYLQREIAAQFGISANHVSSITRAYRWKEVV